VSASVVIVALVATTILPSRVNASDLLERAEKAAQTGTVALQSYRGTVKGENWMTGDNTRAATAATFEQQIAFAAPNKLRLEVTATGANGAAGRQLLVSDGTNAWLYVADAQVAQHVPPHWVLQNGPFAASTLGAALESFAPAFDAKQLADETVAGRATYVLELTPKSGNPMAQRVAKLRFWLDQATLLQLAAEMLDTSGAVLMRWRFDSITLNGEVAADAFTFTPPAGTRIGEILPPQAFQQPGQREQHWLMVARSVTFQLFKPTVGIDGLEELLPSKADNGVVLLPFRVPNGPAVVVITQGPASAFPAATGETITLGEVKATYRVADGVQSLDLDRAGTHVHLQAPQAFPKEAILALAVSLVAVPKP
jgi:outer membrane lipoprotein-sorting protein